MSDSTTQIMYVGGYAAVEIESGQTLSQNESVAVPSELADRLLEQEDNFRRATGKRSTKGDNE